MPNQFQKEIEKNDVAKHLSGIIHTHSPAAPCLNWKSE